MVTDADMQRVRDGIEDIKMAVALHDQKSQGYVDRIVSAQEQVADAVTHIAESTIELRILIQELRKSNGNGHPSIAHQSGVTIDKKTLRWLIGIALAGSLVLGGGQELAAKLVGAILDVPK